MRGLRLLGVLVIAFGFTLSALPARADETPSAAPVSGDDLDLAPPTLPLVCPATGYPPTGKAFWDPTVSPSCLWRCNNGTNGCGEASSATACKALCKAACGAATSCLVLL